jgi:SAM-dependent methyltransferase
MKPAERWLAATWPLVRSFLPEPPAQVVEIGCGSLGGFVPMLRSSGYEATGVDPEAPDDEDYRPVEFENAGPFSGLDAVVASTSLHHVADPGTVIDVVASALVHGGTVVVVEWDWEAFDEPTAEWCFERLGSEEEGWLHGLREKWLASGRPWPAFVREWAQEHELHRAGTLLGLLDQRFQRTHLAYGPYFFPDLAETTEADELAAIRERLIRPTRVDYVGRLPQTNNA